MRLDAAAASTSCDYLVTKEATASARRALATTKRDTDNAKLSYVKVKAARMLYGSGEFSYRDLMSVFEVSHGTIRRAIHGDTWKTDEVQRIAV